VPGRCCHYLGKTLAAAPTTRIQLCGRLVFVIEGRRLENALPGRQGRLLFGYLAAHRLRPASRDQLIEAVWPQRPPAAADSALSALLSKLRVALAPASLSGKQELSLVLPGRAWIDVEAASEGLHHAESAVSLGEWTRAWAPARIALHAARREFLVGLDAPWIDENRRLLADVRLRALECVAAAGLGLGGPELAAAERSGRALIEAAPFRESGYRFLMEALAARDNVAEALVVYDELRRLLRDELGIAPSHGTQELHRRLIGASPRPVEA
jgi:DNA-binding SARP family transcriptional activator